MLRSIALALVATNTASYVLAKESPAEALKLATTPCVQDSEWAGWWPHRHADKLTERDAIVGEGRPLQLVFVGDSITHGWENGGKSIWAERFGPRGAFNIGFSGDRTEHVLWRLGVESGKNNNEIAGLTPKLFVVMIGTNNTGHRQDPPEAIAEGIEQIVDRLLEVAPDSKVLLLAIFARGENADDPLRVINDGVNELIAELGDRDRVEFLDINDVFLDDDGTLPKSVMPDLLHPNTEGYQLWADAIEPHVARLLGEK
ncbi:GDSL-like Lipase/Acylhydrolase [Botrimarina colliarenosi]|uniref:GDSL-like Lipase/Acylhydrolase n=1 Tax=Botrimarina colliarenosi TaxID=2528001 RepID=A0A5C6ACR3_9BACT|nr:GDSL-type esterase/lipase family protein [Botrimarina colliarenosi]TWT96053.1 GDSL-like Lipase/Acylhydrolase [Botrimarina colliarenosi]